MGSILQIMEPKSPSMTEPVRSLLSLPASCQVALRRFLLPFLILIISFPDTFSQRYFQQEVNYNIEVSLDDERHMLIAYETIWYINNSPDSLRILYFHLWPNAYSNNNTPLARQLFQLQGKQKLFNDPQLRGYIDSLDFKINAQPVQWELLPDKPDICKIILNQPLFTGDSILITTPFRVKIPKGVISRLGHVGQSYQITQWFPKPAVYDETGWHPISYLDQGEFYSEYGRFDVSITLPANYVVGATGELQTPGEQKWLEQLATRTVCKDETIYDEDDFPASSEQTKKLRFTAGNAHDFAWFADKRFHVRKGEVKLPHSGREVTTRVMFTGEQAELWENALSYVNDAICRFSEWIGDYPYQSYTAVQSALSAGAGMEYPGITVVGIQDDAYSLEEVLAHEIAHNWFYAALGSNERRFPFMDEGLTSAYTARYMDERHPNKKLWEVYVKNRKLAKLLNIEKMPVQRIGELQWLMQARDNLEQPLDLPATCYTDLNYGVMLYDKAAIGFNYLRAYLGDSLFDASIQNYYHQWKFRHPQPKDLRNAFESHTEKELTWFFNGLLSTTKQLDYKMVRLKGQHLLVKNKGELPAPLVLQGVGRDSLHFEKWVDGFEGERWVEIPGGDYSEIVIDPNHITPELYRLNNNIRKSGAFPKANPVVPNFLFSVEDAGKHTINYIPAINWTRENKFMIGVALHNGFLLPKAFEYFAMPFYAFGNNHLAGYGKIYYNITPYDKFIRKATISLEGKQFGAPGNQNYQKAEAGLELFFRNRNINSPFTQMVFGNYITASNLSQIVSGQKAEYSSFIQMGYRLQKAGMVNPLKLVASYESGSSFKKTALDLNYKLSYYGTAGLEFRLYAGVMLKKDPEVPFYALSASGRSGREHYLYRGTYPDRFAIFPNTFWSRQMTLSEGGLVTPVNNRMGYSNHLISLSLTSSLPEKAGWIPVKPFINILLNDHGLSEGPDSPFFFEGGLKTGLWNLFEVYVPLVVSRNIQTINGSFKDRIRFIFSLDLFNPVKLKSR